MIDDGFCQGVVSRTTIYTWHKLFKDGRQLLEDNERIGQLSTAVTDENEARVLALQMKDHHMSIRMLAGELNISDARLIFL